jgi:hypothetical protein
VDHLNLKTGQFAVQNWTAHDLFLPHQEWRNRWTSYTNDSAMARSE